MSAAAKQASRDLQPNPLCRCLDLCLCPCLAGGLDLPKRRDEHALALCEGMLDITAALFNVSGRELRRGGRSAIGVARVRQIAMYAAHTLLGLSMKEVGRGFGRDRTTVLYACHLVEDMRDDAEFDKLVAVTERVALAAFRGRVER